MQIKLPSHSRRKIRLVFFIVLTAIFCPVVIPTLFAQAQNSLPVPDHIVIVILENHAYSDIIGSESALYINQLAKGTHSALFSQYYGIEHPSQPNYLDLFSGCNQGVTDDKVPSKIPFSTVNLGRQLLDVGKTFVTYSEDLPSVGFNGASSGAYARKHNPAANWMGTGTNQLPTEGNQPLSSFPAQDFNVLPTVCYVIPNQDNDMHNGSDPSRIVRGDTWVHDNLDSYIQWAQTHNSLFILTFDEDDSKTGNRIVTVFTGPMIRGGEYSQKLNHYSILKSIEDMYGLSYACNAASAKSIVGCWLLLSTDDENEVRWNDVTLYPNPCAEECSIQNEEWRDSTPLRFEIHSMLGEKVYEDVVEQSTSIRIHLPKLPAGMYYLIASDGAKEFVKKLLIE